ncbi:MAG: type III-A CRISPR-associated RAMP protein Csm4 [Chloroflexota bacterium]|nr:type III-A CRISPR-associated RAMP protein Csm4 [Chloroflexota bacterium]
MPEITYYHLAPKAALHIGARGMEQEETLSYVPSDTLFSALFVSWLLRGSPEVWSDAFSNPQETPFLLTSAYPRVGEVRFYPMPRVDPEAYGLPVNVKGKEIRRIAYVSEGIWRRLIRGESLAALYPREDEEAEGAFLQHGALWISREEIEGLPESIKTYENARGVLRPRPLCALSLVRVWARHKVPGVTVSRFGRGSEIYYTGRVVFSEGCGLWFGVQWQKPDITLEGEGALTWRGAFEEALARLADSGLGGERSSGYGAFSWQVAGEAAWPHVGAGDLFVTLSRYHPQADEVPSAFQGDRVRYRLVSVGGYLHTDSGPGRPRRRLRFVSEGSVLRAPRDGVLGDVSDVKPVGFPHPVWRYGLALPVPLEVSHA